ncbi:MAG: DNA replication and repair protein RecF [Gammaproteobacteria bacterium]|nr:DNA replication and repair protein RecF [Gammaproteobacteria bacterium]
MATLERLWVEAFRNIAQLEKVFSADVNVVIGPNGSGKTSFLDAIHLLATARSFTGSSATDYIGRGHAKTTVGGGIRSAEGTSATLGVEKTGTTTICRVDGENVRSASLLSKYITVLPLHARLFQLLDDTPAQRRALLDRVLFHVEPQYLETYKRFHRAVQQRNELLKAGQRPAEFEFWDDEFVTAGELLNSRRSACADDLNGWLVARPHLRELGPVSLAYRPGWKSEQTLREALQDSYSRERLLKNTTVGPHRAELKVLAGGRLARNAVSRGQAKLLTCLLVEAQLAYLENHGRAAPILLIDDIAAELDSRSRAIVLPMLLKSGRQAFVTAIDAAQVPPALDSINSTVFHVEHGVFERG